MTHRAVVTTKSPDGTINSIRSSDCTVKIKNTDGEILAILHVSGTVRLREANGVKVEVTA